MVTFQALELTSTLYHKRYSTAVAAARLFIIKEEELMVLSVCLSNNTQTQTERHCLYLPIASCLHGQRTNTLVRQIRAAATVIEN